MLTVTWAAKGGSGTTVVSCAMALLSARHRMSWLIDLAGDAPAALGVAEPAGPGVHDWIAASSAPPSAIAAISIAVTDQLRVVPAGSIRSDTDADRWADLGAYLAGLDADVVIDAGSTPPPPAGLLAAADHKILVTRACYLALRRAVSSQVDPTGVVVVHEPGRALRVNDIAEALHAPVVAEVSLDPAIARAVDAGLLVARLPRTLTTALQDVAA